MPVPDHVRFAHTAAEIITYGDVRKLSPADQIIALKKRFDYWLIGQIEPLAAKDHADNSLIDAPFPLVILSCVTLETLGSVFFDQGAKKEETRETFEKAAIFTDKNLKGPMEKGFKGKMRELWPNSELDEVGSASDVIYKFFRNSMLHGYRAKGVYLSGTIEPHPWAYDDGFIVIHPTCFWKMVRDGGYSRMFQAVLVEHNAEMEASARKYIQEMLTK